MNLEDAIARIDLLSARLLRIEAEREIVRLQYAYGYYMDAIMMDDMIALFTDDAELQIMDSIFRGKASIERFYKGGAALAFGFARTGPDAHFVTDHPQLQPYVDVAEDGQTARGRFRTLQSAGVPDGRKEWSAAAYENDYRVEDGRWKIARLAYTVTWKWAHDGSEPLFPAPPRPMGLYPDNKLGPDAIDNAFRPIGVAPVRPMRFTHPIGPYHELGQPIGRAYVEQTLGVTLGAPPPESGDPDRHV